MRLCRAQKNGITFAGFYDEERIVPVATAAEEFARVTGRPLQIRAGDNLLDLLPPSGSAFSAVRELAEWVYAEPSRIRADKTIPTGTAELLVPIPRPEKIFLLAGNYADHIKEGGGIAAERAETFPYVFMKPPTTT